MTTRGPGRPKRRPDAVNLGGLRVDEAVATRFYGLRDGLEADLFGWLEPRWRFWHYLHSRVSPRRPSN